MSRSPDGWLTVDATIAGLVRDHGAWAILHRMTEVLRPALLALEKADRKPPRKKKPPPRICGVCNATGFHPEDGDSDCPECGGRGYLTGETPQCSICGDPNCPEPNQKH